MCEVTTNPSMYTSSQAKQIAVLGECVKMIFCELAVSLIFLQNALSCVTKNVSQLYLEARIF